MNFEINIIVTKEVFANFTFQFSTYITFYLCLLKQMDNYYQNDDNTMTVSVYMENDTVLLVR